MFHAMFDYLSFTEVKAEGKSDPSPTVPAKETDKHIAIKENPVELANIGEYAKIKEATQKCYFLIDDAFIIFNGDAFIWWHDDEIMMK